MICVFEVTGGPSRGCRFWVQRNEKLEIGRRSNADFSVTADTHMSRNHCLIEGVESIFRVRDVGSINGTFVNNAKVSSIELCDGDRIRIGNTVLEVRMLEDENPHSPDGIHFSACERHPLQISDDEVTVRAPRYLPLVETPKRQSTVEI